MSAECLRPGGLEFTRELLSMAGLAPCKILDMGSGEGASVGMLSALGFEALGVDKEERGRAVCGDIRALRFPDGSFDAALAECSFFISGDFEAALREARRILKPGGKLLLADVFFETAEKTKLLFEKNGFRIIESRDKSREWREYFIRSVWEGKESYPEFRSLKFEGYRLICAERV